MKIQKIDETRWRIPREGNMRVDGVVYASETMIDSLRDDPCLQQVANVAHLPGILDASLAMPDIHWGYGFPIGGVAAMDPEEGVVSPGGVGYDINCGVRLLRTNLERAEIQPMVRDLMTGLYQRIPTGVGRGRKDLQLGKSELRKVLRRGAAWAVGRGMGTVRDLDFLEERGVIEEADPELVSDRAYQRGGSQLGTLGSGNHFGELQYVDEIYDPVSARALGLFLNGVTLTIHCGSRGLGHQVCTDFLKLMVGAAGRHGIDLPDRQLCCAPLRSPEGREYLAAMAAAANFAFANRQAITHLARETFAEILGAGPRELGVEVVYDVCHNIAKFEEFETEGGDVRRACVHRKGATRAYPPNHPKTPEPYRACGQPVLIPGDMGRYSYVLVGTDRAYRQTFGSTCHGAGRRLSRRQAKRQARGRRLLEEMEERGVIVMAAGMSTVAEEMPEAYKDVADVVDVVESAGISRKVARLRPLGVIKG